MRRNYVCGDVLTLGQVASSKSNFDEMSSYQRLQGLDLMLARRKTKCCILMHWG
ncbi:Hypothetical protein PAS_chr2-1_0003 [Komagataella phaffii GS115]|uniref:Uncharacterized protein n=1 Tax=Komagataella phaffii (strain GS115 / ATCC 20864) TaxID=644223 RepID=C4QZC8_KOMPG|nr:Hypothetical protein PAS_chr2-1_0003 [Komagataella phaffii GS115]CAY68602.1 Hypothetical protein PAS_chr2-1_0003 [Komagataella phaffii GS115]